MEFDAIIIGGGLSGLTAASLLAKSGLASWLSGFKIKVDR
ncbi:NAD(P)-binding protein [Acetobacterium wieringae]|uniref:NAD(P)-binding protein n=2 Tax=Acetobacterium wieringae TaxID=52694 RepID=A0A5D0WLQ3_9FIRM|nr:NAD(P)-binding protein [Acetobacterium wieringae]